MHKLIIAFLTVMTLTGCYFSAPQEASYYDLALPAEISIPGVRLTVSEFENNSGAGQKMRYRLDYNRLVIDTLNKWGASPENMIRQYLVNAMTDNGNSSLNNKQLTLYGKLEIFEIDLTGKEIIMQFAYAVAPREAAGSDLNWQVFRYRTPLEENSPIEFARGFTRGANELSKTIRNEILQKP